MTKEIKPPSIRKSYKEYKERNRQLIKHAFKRLSQIEHFMQCIPRFNGIIILTPNIIKLLICYRIFHRFIEDHHGLITPSNVQVV